MAETHATPLDIRLFGPPDVRLYGQQLPPLRSRRGLWLLALLTLRSNREVERSWLAGTLWADSDEPQALASLRRTLTDLRHALGDQAERLHSPTPHTLRLTLEENSADVTAFDKAIAQGSEESFKEAVKLYRGRLLEGCTEEWVLSEREQRSHAYLTASGKLADSALKRQEFEQSAYFFRRIIMEDALREEAQRGLMTTLAESGNFAAATQCYRDFRILLRREMNADPDPATTALYQTLRKKARLHAEKPLALSPKVRPLSSLPSVPLSLPTPLTNFIGREREIREIEMSLQHARLVSLLGTGGIGKTRLSIRVAQQVAEDFPEGVWFVDLSSLKSPELVTQSVAALLKVREQTDKPLLEVLCEALQTKSLLLILDNCEHLVPACAQLAETLLRQCPHLRIMTTTRQPLGVAGESVWRVPPLSLPECDTLFSNGAKPEEMLAQSEALQLFAERASAVMPTFALTSHSAPATVQICRRLDGIPLALELAAVRVRILSVEQIAQRLHNRFRLLTEGNRTAPQRQQTLRAVIDWSYDLLSEKERLLFSRLAVFAGGWTLEAAEAVCTDDPEIDSASLSSGASTELDIDDILDVLAQLADKSLIVVQGSEDGAVRYRMMESIRDYALERLTASDTEEKWRERYCLYYLSLAEQAEIHLIRAQQAEWLERLEQEHDNIRAVLTWTVDAAIRHRIAASISRFWLMRGYYAEGRAWLGAALTHTQGVSLSQRVHTLGSAAIMACEQNDFVASQAYFEECLQIRRQLGDPLRISRALNNLGLALFHQERYDEAIPLLEESLQIKRKLDDPRGTAQTLGNLGMLASKQERYAQAIELHQECLVLSRELNDQHSIGWALGNLGNIALLQGEIETALHYYSECLPIHHTLQDKRSIAATLSQVGFLACMQGDATRGARLNGAAQSLLATLEVILLRSETLDHEASINKAREQLGEVAFACAYKEGNVMTMEQAIAYALEDTAERVSGDP